MIHREDDQPETIKKRLMIYHNQTAPLVEYYNKKGMLHTVDGSTSIEWTHNEVLKALGE